MTLKEFKEEMKEGVVIYMDNSMYASANVRVLDGYARYDDKVVQVSRDIFDFENNIVDKQLFLFNDEESFLVEIRGIDLKTGDEFNENAEYLKEVTSCICECYDPNIRYTPSKILKLLDKFLFFDNDQLSNSIRDEIKDKIFVYHNTYLGIKCEYYQDYEFVEIYEKYIEFLNIKSKDKEEKEKISEVISEGNPIYEFYGGMEDEDDTDNEDKINGGYLRRLSKNHKGLYYNSKFDSIIQFTKCEMNEYSGDIEYYVLNDNESADLVISINNVSISDIDKYKFNMDKNFVSNNMESLDNNEIIKLLFSDLDEDFIIRNWEKVKINKPSSDIDIVSYSKDSFMNSIRFSKRE